mmetsp:Transcript_504/g.1253  ORF Transcript_504/g.1253 Transcript_504/m.1253 type:complete len:93 (-) Transcript_504:112-390(-)
MPQSLGRLVGTSPSSAVLLVSLVAGGTPDSAMVASAATDTSVDDRECERAENETVEKAEETPSVALRIATVSEIFMVLGLVECKEEEYGETS